MINLKPIIYKSLSTISNNVTDTFPNDFINLPCIQYTEEDNRVTNRYVDRKIQGEYIRYRIDLWGNNSLSQLAIEVDGLMDSLEFNRIACYDVGEPTGLKHKVMRYEIYK